MHFLLPGAVCVVDLSDIDKIGDNHDGESYNILVINNLSYCPIYRFSESVTPLNVDTINTNVASL